MAGRFFVVLATIAIIVGGTMLGLGVAKLLALIMRGAT